MFSRKSSMENRTNLGRVISVITFGILLFMFFLLIPKTAIAEDSTRSVLIINGDNDEHRYDDQSVDIFKSTFENMGYNVTIEKSDNASYFDMIKYNIVVWSSGDDYSPLYGAKQKRMLIDYIIDGGHLIIEGGSIALYLDKDGGEEQGKYKDEFREEVLHVTRDYVFSDVGNLTVSNRHPISDTPNRLPDTIEFILDDPGQDIDTSGDADAVRILPDAVGVYNWSYVNYQGKPYNKTVARISYGLIAYDNDENVTNGGQVVYYAFDIDDIASPDIQRRLIENSEKWVSLPTPPEELLKGSGILINTPPTPAATPTPPPMTPKNAGFEIPLAAIGLLIALYFRIKNRI